MAQVEAQLRRNGVEFSDSRLECDRDVRRSVRKIKRSAALAAPMELVVGR